MQVTHHAVHPNHLALIAPDGAAAHAVAPNGYNMLFAICDDRVPSVARFIFLH